MLRRIVTCCLMGLLVMMAWPAAGQTGKGQDFSNVRVDEMTDGQIRAFMAQVESSGLGDEQLEQIAAARGMNQTEIAKLRQRVERIKRQEAVSPRRTDDRGRTVTRPESL